MQYRLRFPRTFDAACRYPLIVYLHGAGTRGTDLGALDSAAIFRYAESTDDFPALILAPLCEAETWFDVYEQLLALIDTVAALPFVDREKISLAGVSMGGYASWQVLMSRASLFSAAVICCGGGMYWNAAKLKNIPIKAYHGEKDTAVYPSESRHMVDAVNREGGRASLVLLPDCDHNCWDAAFADAEVYRFLLRREG